MTQAVRHCEAHGTETRLTCAECGAPICPECMVRTDVGLRCRGCSAPVGVRGASRRRLATAAAAAVAGLGAVATAVVLLTGGDAPQASSGRSVGSWEKGPPLQLVRGSTNAVTLDDGRVAVVGGGLGSVPIGATELFDAAAGSWEEADALVTARRGHTAVLLDDGRLLVVGGIAEGELLASAEVFDPATGTWQPAGEMAEARLGHTMTRLADGRVLVTGGTGGGPVASQGRQSVRPVASAEVFDPQTATWTAVGVLTTPRFEHTATLLDDGRVLVAGGLGLPEAADGPAAEVVPLASAELFDPATGRFAATDALAAARTDHAAVALADGRVLVVGGEGGGAALSVSEVFDPSRGSWSAAAGLARARRGHSATLLDDGTVLVAGGEAVNQGSRSALAAAERYDPAADAWLDAGAMSCPRSEHGAAALPDGTVLVVAGDAVFPGDAPIAQSCVDRYSPGKREAPPGGAGGAS